MSREDLAREVALLKAHIALLKGDPDRASAILDELEPPAPVFIKGVESLGPWGAERMRAAIEEYERRHPLVVVSE